MTAGEIATARRHYRERIEALLSPDELARFDAYQQRVAAALARQDPEPVTPTAEEQAVLARLAEDTQAGALRKQLDVLLRIETLPQ
jgi:hypothetical protein